MIVFMKNAYEKHLWNDYYQKMVTKNKNVDLVSPSKTLSLWAERSDSRKCSILENLVHNRFSGCVVDFIVGTSKIFLVALILYAKINSSVMNGTVIVSKILMRAAIAAVRYHTSGSPFASFICISYIFHIHIGISVFRNIA